MSDTQQTTERKTRTITLTGRRPVKIVEDEWPVIAVGSWSDHDNQYEFQANRKWKAACRVRQHKDGRAIVYAVYDYDTHFQGEADFMAKAGELLEPGEDLAEAIRRVGETLIHAIEDASSDRARGVVGDIRNMIRECIADLPAEEV